MEQQSLINGHAARNSRQSKRDVDAIIKSGYEAEKDQQTICKTLNDFGLKTPNGKDWQPPSLSAYAIKDLKLRKTKQFTKGQVKTEEKDMRRMLELIRDVSDSAMPDNSMAELITMITKKYNN
jgi:hypothetical protein